MKYVILVISILFCSQSIQAQSGLSRLKQWFSPSQKTVTHNPKLDTADAMVIDSAETFFSKHYSDDLDDDGISDDEQGENEEELFYLDSLESIGIVHHIKLKNEEEWLEIDTLFIHFDSSRVNPYHFNPNKILDTFSIEMYGGVRNWSMPLHGRHYVTSRFGPRGSSNHYGTDIGLDIGDSVKAVFDGVIRISKYNPGGYGNYVLIRHYNGTETIYGHLSERLVSVGQEVKAGDLIGWGGNTGRSSGPHLHLEVRYKGVALNPQLFFDFENNTIKNKTITITPSKIKTSNPVARKKVYHKVKRGETLYGISQKYNVKTSQICKLNGIRLNSVLNAGRTLRIR